MGTSKSMWEEFGFTQTPYRVSPLEATADDCELFTSRDAEGDQFVTMMDSFDGAFVVVSGDIGIGKTSFVNIQQHLLASSLTGWGPKLLPCLRMTSLLPQDTPTSLAQRIVHDATHSIGVYCTQNSISIPAQCASVGNWLSHRPSASGYQISVGPFGVGRSWSLPRSTLPHLRHGGTFSKPWQLKCAPTSACLVSSFALTMPRPFPRCSSRAC